MRQLCIISKSSDAFRHTLKVIAICDCLVVKLLLWLRRDAQKRQEVSPVYGIYINST